MIKVYLEEKLPVDEKNIQVTPIVKKVPPPKYELKEIHKHRVNITEVLRWSNATPIRRRGDLGYMCCYCTDQYQDPADLKKHTLETHTDVRKTYLLKTSIDTFVVRLDITSLQCKICNKSIETVEQLMKHLEMEHQKKIYNDIKSRITPLKFVTETLQCCICMKTFDKFKVLLEHLNSHYRNYICEICDAGFPYSSSLRSHMLAHNTGTFKCDYCTRVYDTNAKKKMHEKTVHLKKSINLHKCGYCNETFNDMRSKEDHLVSLHGVKMPTPKCQACDKVFKNRQKLSVHIKKDHLMERRHKCTECYMRFFQSTELRDHMIKHNGIRAFKCSVCLKAFCRARTLREHMKVHDVVRQFKCEHCGQAFVNKGSWRGHMKSKHGEIV